MDKNTIITSSGLHIAEVVSGTGSRPAIGDNVMIHYVLRLGDGVSSSDYDYDKQCYNDVLVDSTYEGPCAGPIYIEIGAETPKDGLYERGQSIRGLDEALLAMRVGSKCKLWIPSELAYGEEGGSSFHTFHGYRTPPHRGLDIVVELLSINSAEEK